MPRRLVASGGGQALDGRTFSKDDTMTDHRKAAGSAGTPLVPVYACEIIVGRAYETPDRKWAPE